MAKDKCRTFGPTLLQRATGEKWGFSIEKQNAKARADKEVERRKGQGEEVILEGQGCTHLDEPLPRFERADCEFVEPQNNPELWGRHRVVFGRDRHTREALTGYGGRGCTTAGSIDLVVGSQGSKPNPENAVGPNFFTDAARIYISQRADIDKYFNLPIDENVGILSSDNRSAIGIKADSVRIIGREGIRLVTNARTNGSTPKEFNSRGERIQSDGPDRGIHLIAHRRTGTYRAPNPILGKLPVTLEVNRLQSLVKGENLVVCLEHLVDQVMDLSLAVENFSQAQMEYNLRLAFHSHPTSGGVAFPDPGNIGGWAKSTLSQIKDHILVLGTFNYKLGTWYKNTFLSSTSPFSFLSRYNKTN